MPLSIRLPTPVSVVHVTAEPPLVVRGRALATPGESVEIEVPEGTPPLANGTSLILDFPPDAGAARAIVVVERHEGRRLIARVDKVPRADLREYPRVHGGVALTYGTLASEAAADEWLRGGAGPAKVRDPDPFMNFSATGLAFEDIESCREGDLLALSVGIPGSTVRWRATAKVVRVARIPIDERDEDLPATHRIAVHFVSIPDEAREALLIHTDRIQEAYL
jgi:hypothetical protein